MMHVCFLQSGPIDPDAVAHQSALRAAGATVDVFDVAPQMPLMLRDAARLRRTRSRFDAVVSSGRAAMRVAEWSGIGRRIHLPSGPLLSSELSALRRTVCAGAQLVTSSAAVYKRVGREVADSFHVRLIRSTFADELPQRREARAGVGAGDSTAVVYVPGVWHNRQQHAMAMWAAGVLVFRDPAVRLLVDGGGNDGVIHRLVQSRGQTASVRVGRPGEWAFHAAAANVALCTGDYAPPFSILNLLHRTGIPIIATHRLWHRERLAAQIPATLVEIARPRFLARAMLEALERTEHPRPVATANSHASAAIHAWSSLLEIASPNYSENRA